MFLTSSGTPPRGRRPPARAAELRAARGLGQVLRRRALSTGRHRGARGAAPVPRSRAWPVNDFKIHFWPPGRAPAQVFEEA